MDGQSIMLMAKIARKEAGKIVPEKGERGFIGLTGKPGRDGKDGSNGRDGVDGRDGIDGKDGRDGKNGSDGVGKDGATWHLTFEEPDDDIGRTGDFVLNGSNSNVYHRKVSGWEFVVHLKAEVPQFQMQAPRAYSPEQIREIANVAVEAADKYHLIDEDSENDVKYYGFGKDDNQGHYIEKVDTSSSPITYRVSVGVSDYATDWTDRASLTYSRRTEVDIP